MNRHSLSMPRVPAILQFSKTTFMGVVYLSCTIADARMPVLVREFQSRLLRDGPAQSIPDTNYRRIVG
jgi:hypothetical protein